MSMTNLPKDPIMLLSVINTHLRDHYKSLDALCDDLDIDSTQLIKTLSNIDYIYHPETNQFI